MAISSSQSADHVTFVEHEHLVDDLVGLDAVGVVQVVDFRRHRLRAAHAVAVGAERRVDAAERALIRTAQRGVDRGVGLPRFQIAEALPVVGPVFLHRQQIPDVAVQVLVEILDQRRREIIADLIVVPPHQALHLGKIVRCVRAKASQGAPNRYRPLAVAGEVDWLLAQRTLR